MNEILKNVSPILQKFIVKYDDFKIGKLIGQGAFGKVYYAVHKPTKKKCAVKKLFIHEMAGQDLISYCREVEVLVKCDSPFILPFYGWSTTFPYIIVTEHIPNGSLFSALHHRPLAPQLSATNKTLIAIGIASGMASLHSVGIIHRDLKSLNILLDENNLPKIGDFGLSRFQNDEASQMTADVGTSHWMAPELFETTKYTNKIDVYAFGMLMWEMYNEAAPFHGMNSVQIAFQVSKENYRPPWPDDTPSNFKAFVAKCWDQNPNNRPTFKQILNAFLAKKIFFPGTDLEFVTRLRADINFDEKKRLANEDNRIPPLAVTSKSSNESKAKRRKPPPLDDFDETPAKSDFEQLPQPSSSEFAEIFTKNINYITKNNISEFFKMVSPYLPGNGVPDDVILLILRELHKILSDDAKLSVYLNLDFHKMLPVQKPAASNLAFLLLLNITTRKPEVVDLSFIHSLEPAIVSNPAKILSIIAPFFLKFDSMKEKGFQVLDFIIKNCEPFLLGAGDKFIHTLYYLCTTYESVINARFDYFVKIINFALELRDVGTVKAAYSFATKFYMENFSVDPKLQIMHIAEPELRKYALSFHVKKIRFQMIPELIWALIRIAPTEKIVIGMLNNYFWNSAELCKLFLGFADKWMISASLETKEILGFILIMASVPTLREQLSQVPQLIDVFSAIIDTEDVEMIDLIAHLILKLVPSQKLISNLSQYNFFPAYFDVVKRLSNDLLTLEALLLLDVLSRQSFIPEFLNQIHFIIDSLKNPKLEKTAASALVSLSSHGKAVPLIKKEYSGFQPSKSSSQQFLIQLERNISRNMSTFELAEVNPI